MSGSGLDRRLVLSNQETVSGRWEWGEDVLTLQFLNTYLTFEWFKSQGCSSKSRTGEGMGMRL